ncbi:MAG: hypothetical protein IKN04_14220 [Clostridia bacterium]|nr:hypothetical protein [Clostridia bacterium]
MIDITKPGGMIFIVIALLSLIGLMYSVVEFIRWQIRYLRNGDYDLPPFGIVGAVIIGALIVAGIIFCLMYIGVVDFGNRLSEAVWQI